MVVAQGKTTIPNVDDGEEMSLTDVRFRGIVNSSLDSIGFDRVLVSCFRIVKLTVERPHEESIISLPSVDIPF